MRQKNHTLKCLKRHYSTVESMKNVAVLTEDGAFALFFHPHPGGFHSSRVPTPGDLPSREKTMLKPRGQPKSGAGGGWVQLELTNAYILISIVHPSLISKFEIRGCKGTWLNSTVEKTRGSIPGGVTSFTTIKSTSVITSLITKNNII